MRMITTLPVLAAAAAFAAPASAATTFAQFLQSVPGAKIFSYTNLTPGTNVARLSTIGTNNTVLVSNLGSLPSPTTAKISLTAFATSLPTLVGGTISEMFSGKLTFTLLSPLAGLHGQSVNALTVTFTNAQLIAAPGAAAPTLQASEDGSTTITYASEFLDLSQFTQEDFALSFSGASSLLNLNNTGRLPNFRMSGSGTFAAAVPGVPEPANWLLMLGGFGMIGGAMRRRKASLAFA